MPLCRSPLTLRLALFSRSRTAAVEIPRFILHRRRSEFLPLHRGAEKRAQFALQSTGEARALPRRTQSLPKCEPQLSPPKRAALIRHGAAQKRSTAPPSPMGRLCAPPQSAELHRGTEICAPSHSVSTEKGSTLSVLPFLRFIYRAPTL